MQPILKKKDKSDRKLPQMLHYNYVQCHKVIVTYTGNFGREIEIIKRREKEWGRKIVEEIMAGNSSNLVPNLNLQIQESQ